MSKAKYYLNQDNRFVIENYHLAKPFSSFFPGIAGIWGIPMWAFYVNRGQAIASFGIRDKDHPIMEFFPANKSYQLTSNLGFRTFIKTGKSKQQFYDCFHNGANSLNYKIENRMEISAWELSLIEANRTLGLEVRIDYFTVPSEDFAALARKVTIANISKSAKEIEVIDGMPRIIPFGLNNWFLKHMSRTIEAWIDVDNLENCAPFTRLRVDAADRSEVVHIKEGYFGVCFDDKGVIKPIIDPSAVFGHVDDFSYPHNFISEKKFKYPSNQMRKNKIPSFLNYCAKKLKPKQSYSIFSLVGHMDSLEKLKKNTNRIASEEYCNAKRSENRQIIDSIQKYSFTHSASSVFDAYCQQNFLDNVLRGGLPVSFGTQEKFTNLSLYSRKHGDLERDYNNFLVEPTCFSQGNGNFRDVNQNRRSDIWFNPKIKEESLVAFFNLIQSDGYNPLVIKPEKFVFRAEIDELEEYFSKNDLRLVENFLQQPFTPGEFLNYLSKNNIKLQGKKEELLDKILVFSTKILVAEHGEGFWTDHWHYCLDLLQSYLKIYPENLKKLFFEEEIFTFFDNAFSVLPRNKRYVLHDAKVRQFESVAKNEKKQALIDARKNFKNISRSDHGVSEVYRTTLASKMLTIIANKFASLDAFGVGIEMEADKPNWCDALNGLPGLLGSSLCETLELKRWILFLKNIIENSGLNQECLIRLPHESHELINSLEAALRKQIEGELDDFAFWNKAQRAKEVYREQTLMGFEGAETCINIENLLSVLDLFLDKINKGVKKAFDEKSGLCHSYFINEVSEFEKTDSGIVPLKFKQVPLPLYLEGVVHFLRTVDDEKLASKVTAAVKKSDLFDKKLKMFKINASLEKMPEEIGRCRIFTPGWLENESIWLHMEYKYLLELLKNSLYDEFFENFKNCLVAFQPASRYGRSILENSSFICSSAFPQIDLHGNGFVARLSGSTAEFVNIWLFMCLGDEPFYLDSNNSLCLEFRPVLPKWLFTSKTEEGFEKGTFAFKFLNKTLVVYHNKNKKNTFGKDAAKIKRIEIRQKNQQPETIESSVITAPLSFRIRNQEIEQIDCFLE